MSNRRLRLTLIRHLLLAVLLPSADGGSGEARGVARTCQGVHNAVRHPYGRCVSNGVRSVLSAI